MPNLIFTRIQRIFLILLGFILVGGWIMGPGPELERPDIKWKEVAPDLLYAAPIQGVRDLHMWRFRSREYELVTEISSRPKGESSSEVQKRLGALLVVNAGYFDRDSTRNQRPSGLLVHKGQKINKRTQTGGSGVYFVDDKAMVGILPLKELKSDQLKEAVQAGPLLVDPGGEMGIQSDNNKLFLRTALCQKGDEFTIVVTSTPMSLFYLANSLSSSFHKIECERALNLDGGPSTQLEFASKDVNMSIKGGVRVHNFLVLKRKKL